MKQLGHNNKYRFSVNRACQGHNNGHVTVFPLSSSMRIYLRCQCFMSTFRYLLWSRCCVQALVVPTGLLLIQICNNPRVLYRVNQLASLRSNM